MAESRVATTRAALPVDRWLHRIGGRLQTLHMSVSFWDPAGTLLAGPAHCGELCELLNADQPFCHEAMARLAQQACVEDTTATATSPCGCCMMAAPIHQRRRLIAAAVACFPTGQTHESEEFARICSQARIDRELAAALARTSACHELRELDNLRSVLEWIIEDEQGSAVAEKELATLSTNLANTYEELSMLYRISGSMKVTQSCQEFFDNICQELLEVMHLQAAAVLLSRREHSNSADQVVCAGDWPLSEGQLTQVFRRYLSPRLAASRRAMVDNQFASSASHLGEKVEQIRTLIAVPLMSADNFKGVLVGVNKLTGEFDTIDLKLISSISSQAAVFLENYHLYEDLQDLLMGMLHALTASIDAKDPYTCGHSRRVALVSRKLAEMSGFDAQRAGRMYLAGLMHDVGKIGMPESVLCKNGRLTEEEYGKVKQHPGVGAGILSGIRQMQDVVPAILYHHERPDGRGYPDGLSGREIAIEALIVGLADSFDAMTSSRTYRNAMPLEAVVAEIRRCSGTQFDAHLVELLLGLDLAAFLDELRRASAADVELAEGVKK
ncbi:MAG: HD domain-containing phosphohydrolase [Planctomycetota bacterium]|jgi:HD-GYP domain-containing protein (c-di-GMP phosphodiesterase class II)